MCPFYWFHEEINNTQGNNAKDNYAVTPMNNVIENSDSYSKKSGPL